MKLEFPFIGVDWGTSRMRAMFCDAGQSMIDSADIVGGDGISKLDRPAAEALFEAVAPWVQRNGKLDIVLAGMVGANIGWRPTPYLACPLDLRNLPNAAVSFTENGHAISILPGVSCENAFGQPDLMRGEELQVLGWLSQHPDANSGERLLCLPGTHTKWVCLRDGRIESFTTSLTGELYALLYERSVLVPPEDRQAPEPFQADSFLKGVDLANRERASLIHALFSTRSKSIIRDDGPHDSGSYLSGILIGSDVGLAATLPVSDVGAVEIIGDEQLANKFALALRHIDCDCRVSDGIEMVYAGFVALASGAGT